MFKALVFQPISDESFLSFHLWDFFFWVCIHVDGERNKTPRSILFLSTTDLNRRPAEMMELLSLTKDGRVYTGILYTRYVCVCVYV